MSFLIELGSKVKSTTTGFQGIVTSRSEHLNGCYRYWVQPWVSKDGKVPDGSWYDEPELKVIQKPLIQNKKTNRGGFPSKIK